MLSWLLIPIPEKADGCLWEMKHLWKYLINGSLFLIKAYFCSLGNIVIVFVGNYSYLVEDTQNVFFLICCLYFWVECLILTLHKITKKNNYFILKCILLPFDNDSYLFRYLKYMRTYIWAHLLFHGVTKLATNILS